MSYTYHTALSEAGTSRDKALVRYLANHAEFRGLLWHFTNERAYAGIERDGLIRSSDGTGLFGVTAGSELGGVSLFDFSSLTPAQLSGCILQACSFICEHSSQRLIAVRGDLPLIRYPATRDLTKGHGPIPWAEVIHRGPIGSKDIVAAYRFEWTTGRLHLLPRLAK